MVATSPHSLAKPKKFLKDSRALLRAVWRERPDLVGQPTSSPVQGQQATTVLIGQEVFKAPSQETQRLPFERELEAHLHLAATGRLPVPAVTHRGAQGHFYGMKKISGERMTPELVNSLSTRVRHQLAGDLAFVMLGIRDAFTADDVKRLGIPTMASVSDKIIRAAFDHPRLRASLTPSEMRIAEGVATSASRVGLIADTVCHGDLKDENVLFNRDADRLSGVLDFGLISVRDPVMDLSKLGNLPRPFVADVAAHYKKAGGRHIDVENAIQLYAAARLADLGVQIRYPVLETFVAPSLANLKLSLANLAEEPSAPSAVVRKEPEASPRVGS